MSKQVILALVATIIVAFVIGALWQKSRTEPDSTTNGTGTQQTPANAAERDLGPGTPSTDPDLYGYIQDAGFVAFAYATIEKKCPFYSPNGAAYRECLTTWMDSLVSKLPPREQDAIEAKCAAFAESYADASSHAGGELFAKCVIYHASNYQ